MRSLIRDLTQLPPDPVARVISMGVWLCVLVLCVLTLVQTMR